MSVYKVIEIVGTSPYVCTGYCSQVLNGMFAGSRSYVSGLLIGFLIAVALLGVRTRLCLITC